MLKQRPGRCLKLAKVVDSQKVPRDKGTEFRAELLLNAVLRALLLGYVSITTSLYLYSKDTNEAQHLIYSMKAPRSHSLITTTS
jgi:hypothetical protein